MLTYIYFRYYILVLFNLRLSMANNIDEIRTVLRDSRLD